MGIRAVFWNINLHIFIRLHLKSSVHIRVMYIFKYIYIYIKTTKILNLVSNSLAFAKEKTLFSRYFITAFTNIELSSSFSIFSEFPLLIFEEDLL